MKKALILAAVAAVALSACSKNEIIETINKVPEEVAIGFSNYSPKTVTKANSTYTGTTSLAVNEKFAVMSYATTSGNNFGTATGTGDDQLGTQFMNMVPVKWVNNASNGANNEYSPVRYWPAGDTPNWLTFWAYYPVVEAAAGGIAENTAATNNGIVYTAPTGSNEVGSFSFKVADNAADMVDFMVSDVVSDKIYGTASGVDASGATYAVRGEVPLVFHHTLTRVQFYFLTDKKDSDKNTDVVLKTVNLSNVYTHGNLATAYPMTFVSSNWSGTAVESPTPIVFSVVNSTDGSFKLEEKNAQTPSKSKVDISSGYPGTYATSYPVNGDIYLMIPQDLTASDPVLTITYDIKTYSTTSAHADGDLLSSSSNTATVHLKDIFKTGSNTEKITSWDMNNIVTYTFIIGAHPIQFTASVNDWTPDIQGELNID